jgi:hypothetical protein
MFLAQRQENLYYFIAPIKKNNLYIYITNIDFPLTELVYAKCIYTNYNLYSQSSFFFFWISTEYPGQGSTNSGGAQVLNKKFLTSEPQ